MAVVEVARTIRNAKRYTEILDVLVRHGFADVVGQLGLDRLLQRGYQLIGRPTGEPLEHVSRPERMRRALEELGPTFMKLGQMLSCRKDLIPEDWADEFAKLQAEGPSVPYEVIEEVLSAEFRGRERELFASIEPTPLAAASMAQVHRAMLRDPKGGDRPIVLKILKPGTEERTQADLEILRTIATFVERNFRNVGFHPNEVVREFARELKREVDFTYEGRSTEKLRAAFADDPNVCFPAVYWEATTRRVLALEELRGVLLSTLKEGDLTAEQRAEVIGHGATAVARQCLEIGLFHADPHPGNLFAIVRDDGHVTAGFIDCGMTGHLEPRDMDLLARLVKAVATADVEESITVASTLANVAPSTMTDPSFRADLAELARSFEVRSFGQFDLPGLLNNLFETMRAHHISFPSQLILLIKSLTTIESVGRSLDPTFDLVSYLRPSIERVVARRFSLSALRRRVQGSLEQYATLLEDFPREIKLLLGEIRRNNFAVNLQHKGLSHLTRVLEHASRNIGFSLIVTGLTVSSAILVHAGNSADRTWVCVIGLLGFVLAALMSIGYVFANRKWIRERQADRTED